MVFSLFIYLRNNNIPWIYNLNLVCIVCNHTVINIYIFKEIVLKTAYMFFFYKLVISSHLPQKHLYEKLNMTLQVPCINVILLVSSYALIQRQGRDMQLICI